MSSAKPEKARIRKIGDPEEKAVECLFNPSDYTFSKRNGWKATKVKGKNVPDYEFEGGEAIKLEMQLFFDTYATGEDVRKKTDGIWKFMYIAEDLTDSTSTKGEPPKVEFRWGQVWTFNAVIENINQKFTLFRYDGTPVRATLDVTFLQVKEEGRYPGQNPTTVGRPGYKRRLVKEGDTIDWIAHEEYGDSAMWRFIAETNSLDNPGKLRPGQVLAIAPRP